MRKRLFAAICGLGLLVGATPSHAGIDVLWSAAAGFYPLGSAGNSGDMGILNPAVSSTQMAIAHLIFSPTMDIDPALAGPGADPNFLSGNDTLLDTFLIINDGDPFEEYAFFSAPNFQSASFTPGFIYARVFAQNTPEIDVGTGYWNSPIVPLEDKTPGLGSPQSLDINLGTAADGADVLNQTVGLVPEPSTLALCGLGLITLARRRRRIAA